jgi:hypothetical protein
MMKMIRKNLGRVISNLTVNDHHKEVKARRCAHHHHQIYANQLFIVFFER